MSILAPSCESKKTGEGERTILGWCTKGANPDPFNPRVRYLFNKINPIFARKDISDVEKTKLLEEVKALALALSPDFDKFVRADEEDTDEEEEEQEDEDSMYELKTIKLLREKTDEEEEEDMDEDEGSVEVEGDGEMGKLQLGDQEKPGVAKRPQSSPVQSELECKKPRVAQGLAFPGGELVAAEM